MKLITLLIASAFLPVAAFAADFESTLKAMKESLITDLVKNKEIIAYRFTCIPTFNHPFSIKIIKTADGFKMYRKVLSGKGGWEPGVLAESVMSDVTEAAIHELDKLLRDLKFLEMAPDQEYIGFDGSPWILEVVKDGTYTKVVRVSPNRDDPMIQLGKWFLKTSQWSPPKPE